MNLRRPPGRRECVLATFAVAILVAGCVFSDETAPPASSLPTNCDREYLNTEALQRARDKRNASLGEPAPGESIITLTEPNLTIESTWAFHTTGHNLGSHDGAEGFYQRDRLDYTYRRWTAGGQYATSGRKVYIGRDVWENRLSTAWFHCQGDRETIAPDEKNLVAVEPLPNSVAQQTATTKANQDSLLTNPCLVLAMPGSRMRVRDPVRSTVDGERLTTYEVVGFARHPACPMRVIMTVDEQLRIRGGKAWNTETGQVNYTLTAGPAPGHPAIVDPSNQPVFGDEPDPPAPTTSIVAPGQRPDP